MEILVRKYKNNRDKSNKKVEGIDNALKSIGKDFKDIYLAVSWGKYVDLFFIGTNDYLRVIN